MPSSDSPESLAARLDTPDGIAIEDLQQALDALDNDGRLTFIRAFRKQRHLNLWNMAKGHMEADLDNIVPPDLPTGSTVVFEGRNSMAMFNLFQKRFQRPDNGEAVWGYNEQSFRWFSGPGYFIGKVEQDGQIFYLHYDQQPPSAPEGWPVVKTNTGFPRGLVYGFDDEVRPVSQHVVIGMPTTKTTAGEQYFVATRHLVL